MATLFTMNADIFDFIDGNMVAPEGMLIFFDLAIDGDWLKVSEGPRASLVQWNRTIGYIRSDGRMYDTPAVTSPPEDVDDPGGLGVRLLANDIDILGEVTYNVSGLRLVSGRRDGPDFPMFNTGPVPVADTEEDLALYAPDTLGLGGPPPGGGDFIVIDGGAP